ncbi:MAG: 2-thiouracil desulfurase family protein [Patescibacteria group bacterium]|nr:2-thiouracil desulfurase family protein [Patescibacteria group bacterium]
MKRSKKIVFACHCLLNQNARAQRTAKCHGVVKEFIDFCIENEYGIVAIDCPQLQFEPLIREPATKEYYDNSRMKIISKIIAKKVIEQIKAYLENDYQICGIFGIEGSPSCGAIKTHILSGDGKSVSVKGSGVFIDELKKSLNKAKLEIPIFDWDIQAKKLLAN